ncbi:AMP-binding protein [[Mycobacterium] vasticus]|uniref:AMP-binding protein n=1 Tax=[Mycobacterium] vasticus TaxID=2875777 RepID=A0ABU5Z2W5_9MYCO|nr:AMP-binding protein [Mycolicibacter sp. MYC017]MEB3070288.1 AMP-binding protein [Mycolicibacter sp. MYC017]
MTAAATTPAAASMLPDRSVCVLRHILERRAVSEPDSVCVVFGNGAQWDAATVLSESNKAGNVLYQHGVRHGQRVLALLENGPDALRCWWGTQMLGAVWVPVNPAYRGAMLAEVCQDTDPACIVSTAHGAALLREAGIAAPILDVTELVGGADAAPPLDDAIEPWTPASVTFTSGTTGRSKGALATYLSTYAVQEAHWASLLGPGDRHLVNTPLFHIGAQHPTMAALSLGAAVVFGPSFSATQWVEDIRQLGVTSAILVGTMPSVIENTPARDDDATLPLRSVVSVPMVREPQRFTARFGLDNLVSLFGMTETGVIVRTVDTAKPDSCGRVRAGADIRLVDDHDYPVSVGAPGELVVRTDRPWELAVSYIGRPEETNAAWRNGWFHTGDIFVADAEGDLYFVDRKKDYLRRRGENISTFEVEREVLAHPDVTHAACVGADDGHGGDDVRVFVVLAEAATIDPAALREFLLTRLAAFMLPRYIDVVDALPLTPTGKVKKHELRARPLGPATWQAAAR